MTAFPLAPPEPLVALPPHGEVAFALERPQDHAAAEALIDHAFGPGRFAKTAERLREGQALRADLSICAWDGAEMVGVVRQWSVFVGDTPAIFLGPFAVHADRRKQKLGRALIERAVALNDAAGERATILVGDRSYFGPRGFEPVPVGTVVLPGPVDPKRIMWRGRTPGDLAGLAGPLRTLRR
jgi:predicted N-acetyltransferase YhbS